MAISKGPLGVGPYFLGHLIEVTAAPVGAVHSDNDVSG